MTFTAFKTYNKFSHSRFAILLNNDFRFRSFSYNLSCQMGPLEDEWASECFSTTFWMKEKWVGVLLLFKLTKKPLKAFFFTELIILNYKFAVHEWKSESVERMLSKRQKSDMFINRYVSYFEIFLKWRIIQVFGETSTSGERESINISWNRAIDFTLIESTLKICQKLASFPLELANFYS